MSYWREQVQKLLKELKKEGVDPREVLEAGSAYLVTLGVSITHPKDEDIRKRLNELESPGHFELALDAAHKDAEKELARRGLAGQAAWAIANLLSQVLFRAVLSGGKGGADD